jgi:hypothetical protein
LTRPVKSLRGKITYTEQAAIQEAIPGLLRAPSTPK